MLGNSRNLYLHVDGDSFFVACELTKHPEYKGKPVIVGADRGIAVAMSREAKKLGVTRGMPVFQIKKLFPEVIILPHHFDLYNEIAEGLHRILESYFQTIEVYSIDECFALVEPSEVKYFGDEKKLLLELKQEIEKTLGVTYSIGLARTKALAKQASKLEKPGGVVMLLTKADEMQALKRTPIDDIWGIGRQTVPRLRGLGLSTAYDFINYSEKEIEKNFSEPLRELQRELRGEQVFGVKGDADPRDQKSIQSTSTFRPASTDPKIIWQEIARNAERACENARSILLVSNKVSFFVKNSDFKYKTDEVKLPLYTADPGVVLNAIEMKLLKLLNKRERIRSTGVILHNLTREENVPLDLFGRQDKMLKGLVVEEVADKIRKKYGASAIKRVASLKRRE
ncbi:MAG: DNA polymerase IV [Candidatus Paceibacterota bacterium]